MGICYIIGHQSFIGCMYYKYLFPICLLTFPFLYVFLVSYSAFLRALVCCGPGHPLNIYLGFACTCDELELGVGNLKENVGDYGKLVSPLPEESRMRCFMSITRCGGNGLNYPEGFTCLCIGKGVWIHHPAETTGYSPALSASGKEMELS